MHEVLEGIAKTVMDNIRDAEMQYGYAEEAKEHGNHELAALHIEESRKRLAGAKEWYDRGMHMLGGDMHKIDPMAALLMQHHKEWYHSIQHKVDTFKPGV